ncbi:Glutamyl-Q tRNA(Asp) synthetase [Sulfitobacter noctilucicola]|uniref:Glutamyl-Q tRNA(Asp) synthetase n=1 Tax=Sulfitobacter noctilucicola TaxID=1342301 RepID=A0A7W6M765_9RHOB|nr:tRNA glutamyl-Q(34) synthetase GluQRS [Sulfitobacter noctilucicola]KIN65181.1 Glutamyl-Q tRNA(Asp) synthetase [Sulfitobacter noctilucicola]MBB4173685.1 glutamyl-Q tRNA(Asp) synthetase [Sulfitobacter noctilucicola]
MFRTRFAPSPTGPLHLGHAYSALLAYDMAVAAHGEFLLRIEDIDQSRSRPAWETQIYEDLKWLGLSWPEPVMRQSERLEAYADALDDLWSRGLLYECTCRRADIAAAAAAPQEGAPMFGPDGIVYPGTCRDQAARTGPRPKNAVLRLDMARALADMAGLSFDETGVNPAHVNLSAQEILRSVGDVVLARREMGTSYHLSVVLDDAAQGITHVVRGADLFEATQIHVVLQSLFRLPTPVYHHHRLIRDGNGKRLAKRDDARAIALYRNEGKSVSEIRSLTTG